MGGIGLEKDPWNVILTGVGGQGNVFASRMLAKMFAAKGLWVTIGETFGATQRGGSVMSHVRVSVDRRLLSPQIPKGAADWVVALEPLEALRVLEGFGSPEVRMVLNDRPVYPMGVIAGEMDYPTQEALRADLDVLSKEAFWLDLTAIAKALGSPALASTAILGAFVAKSGLSLTKEDAFLALKDSIPEKKLASNLEAFEAGRLAAGA